MSTFTIDRNTWYRGQGDRESRLRRDDGQQCCVGFFANQVCGVDPDRLVGVPSLGTLVENPFNGNDDALEYENTFADRFETLYQLNDNAGISNSEREYGIALEFNEMGVTVTFTN